MNKKTLTPRLELTYTQRKSLGLGPPVKPRERDPNEAMPRTIGISSDSLDLSRDIPSVHYRNDGHKHLKSRGF